MNEPDSNRTQPTALPRPARLMRWFVIGFLLVFIGMSFYPTHFYNGQGLFRVPVWYFYLLSVRQGIFAGGQLGPASGSLQSAMIVAIQHLIVSMCGGSLALGIGWLIRKFSSKK